jgi:large subunit ribosomal protein L21
MYAVIRTGGQQTTVHEGETIDIQKIAGEAGEEVIFDDVLLISAEGETLVGKPRVENATVVGEIVRQFKAPKIRVYTFKRRKGFSRTQGHRQQLTKVRIKEIKR